MNTIIAVRHVNPQTIDRVYCHFCALIVLPANNKIDDEENKKYNNVRWAYVLIQIKNRDITFWHVPHWVANCNEISQTLAQSIL